MDEEFQESDVFSMEKDLPATEFAYNKTAIKRRNPNKRKKKSDPVNIPKSGAWIQCLDSDFFDEEEGEMVPPHVVVARRMYAGKVAYSVFTGNGRTLKGRDLREVRNSILRMTGFLES